MTEWQPIETAPKDGRRILVYAETWPEIAVAEWRDKGITLEGWRLHPFNDIDPEPLTHWMPLPEPPSQ